MGNKFVTVDQNNTIGEVFDEDNNNVPDGAIAITDAEFNLLRQRISSDFEIVEGALQLRAVAGDNLKARIIDNLHKPAMKAFIELLIDELNTLRALHSLPPRDLAQFKTAMKNKLL